MSEAVREGFDEAGINNFRALGPVYVYGTDLTQRGYSAVTRR